jgi:arylsulfatase A-like enzyme
VPAPTGHGRSWTDVLGGADRDAALNEWALGPQRCGVALDLRTVRTRRYRMTFEAGSGAGELYDLDDDPHETVNRYDDLSFAALRAELHERLAARPDDRRPDPLPRVGQA